MVGLSREEFIVKSASNKTSKVTDFGSRRITVQFTVELDFDGRRTSRSEEQTTAFMLRGVLPRQTDHLLHINCSQSTHLIWLSA